MTTRNDTGLDVAVVGATGAVGREMLEILDERDFPIGSLRAMASPRSEGRELPFGDRTVVVENLADADFEGVDLALCSAGSDISREHAPRMVEAGATVVDNTSAFRMDDEIPLVVPEVNAGVLDEISGPAIIANPNCSTIQMVVALAPLDRQLGLERVFVSTYQSASGAGQGGVDELIEELENWANSDRESWEAAREVFDHPLAFEALPHIGSFDETGFTSEEQKMVHETRKIMERPELSVASHCVRVPSIRSHSESLTVDLADETSPDRLRELWDAAPGIEVYDEPAESRYPLARMAEKTDATWIGRIRRDLDRPSTVHFWVVSDNLRKGAALNSIQIAEHLVDTGHW